MIERTLGGNELHEGEELFRLLLESAPDAMVIVQDETIRFVNAQTERLFGYTRDEMLGKPVELLIPERYRRRHQEYRTEYSGSPWVRSMGEGMELVGLRKDGSEFPVEVSLSPLQTSGGMLVSAAMRDITMRIRAEQEASSNRLALEHRNRELQDFAYVASHDLQEPLRKISAFSDLLQDDYGHRLGDEGRYYLGRMKDAAMRMSQLINDLLSFSRVTTSGDPFEKVDLNEIVRDVLSELKPVIDESNGLVEVESLPTIEADPLQMRQLFLNLVSNGLKFSRPDTPPRVRVTSKRVRNRGAGAKWTTTCRIEVTDGGIGFDEKYLDRIFTPFQRLHPRDAYAGTGMGLAICRRIVERHSGEITARSDVEKGSTFIVTLPVSRHQLPRAADS